MCIFYFFCTLLQILKMNPAKRLDWSPKKRSIAITLRKEGYSYREIASKMGNGVSPAGVLKLCKRFETTGKVTNQTGRGRKKATTTLTDRRIVRLALQNRRSTAVDINRSLENAGVKVSDRTVRRRLVAAGMRARIPRNAVQCQKRLQWARQHVLWTKEQWEKVL